jgi:hypothetical protein
MPSGFRRWRSAISSNGDACPCQDAIDSHHQHFNQIVTGLARLTGISQ